MSDLACIILVMQTTWTKRSYVCDPDHCDTLIEVTSNDKFGFPSAFAVTNITCLCGRNMNQVSEEDATIQPTNERNTMENTTEVPTTYNANVLVQYKDITNGEVTFPIIKVTDLEYKLERIKTLEDHLSRSQGTISKIIDNLTMEGWFNPNTDKDEVLRDLCSILDHTPQQEMSWTVTLTVSGTTMVNLEDVEDFDIRYHLGDNLSVDSNDFDTNVDSWDIDLVDSQDWN
jgi:hypothetical protein